MNGESAATAKAVLDTARAASLRLATAESCTGGLIAASLTEIAGSSDVFDCGFVTYSNQSKTDLLGVPADLIAQSGAVSDAVARAMAEGTLAQARADIAVAVTGIAGPGGGTADKPVGLVFIGAAKGRNPTIVERHVFPGDRAEIRRATVRRALELLLNLVGD